MKGVSTCFNEEITKIYFSVSEVAKKIDVPQWTIRYWHEAFGLEIRRKHTGQRHRLFTIEDIEKLSLIKILREERKFTIEGAKQELKQKGLL